ncbi:MAG: 4Fe-4S dicluster domain-containing protein [Bacteroidota bacterium]
MLTLELSGLDELFTELTHRGYDLYGPTVQDKAVVIDKISSVKDLPAGWTDRQEAGAYVLERRSDSALFGYVTGPVSWKKFLYPPRTRLLSLKRAGRGFAVAGTQATTRPKPLAFIGVRACELRALALLDRIFLEGPYADPEYAARRSTACVIAVDCMSPGGTCFCASMGTGPTPREGFDIGLTEICEDGRHFFVARHGSERGEEILSHIQGSSVSTDELKAVEVQQNASVAAMQRDVNLSHVSAVLPQMFEHQAWDDIARRCLACTNCTMVCPTCFCSTVEDTTDLGGSTAERWRTWDSCFVLGYSKVAGGNTRPSTKARYRQWVMHKFSYWIEQFGSPGCVGCGRCITWCPVGIDITSFLESLCGEQENTPH